MSDNAIHDAIEQDRKDLYKQTTDDLYKRQLSNNENFDRSILTLSSAGLALSVTFLQNLESVACFPILLMSWLGFVFAIISTLVSFQTSQWGIKTQLDLAERYYLKNDDRALEEAKNNLWAKATDALAIISAITFIFAIITLLVTFSQNTSVSKQEQLKNVATQKQP